MTDQTTEPVGEHIARIAYATHSQSAAHAALRALGHTAADLADADPACTGIGSEIVSPTTPHRLSDAGEALADRIAARLSEIDRERAQAIEEAFAEQQAADGLDDQDGPVTRARLYAELTDGPVLTWACLPGVGWRYVGLNGWHRDDIDSGGPDCTIDELIPLGWVEIPLRTQPAPATSEEPASE